jgi:hypothetical protein
VLEPPALIDYLREWSQRFGRAAEGQSRPEPVAGREA